MKDQRYRAIKSLIESKSIHSLLDVFTILPISTVKDDMKVNYSTLRNRLNAGETLTVRDIMAMADLFEVDSVEVYKLAINDIKARQKSKKR